jgi:hypothetical protein
VIKKSHTQDVYILPTPTPSDAYKYQKQQKIHKYLIIRQKNEVFICVEVKEIVRKED